MKRPRHTRQEVVAEVEALLPCTAERVAQGLDLEVDSVYAALHRAGRDDLWERLQPEYIPRPTRRRPKPEPKPDQAQIAIEAAEQWLQDGDEYGTQRAIACALISIAKSLHVANMTKGTR